MSVIELTRSSTAAFLDRFYMFYDGYVKSLNLEYLGACSPKSVLTIELIVRDKLRDLENGWVSLVSIACDQSHQGSMCTRASRRWSSHTGRRVTF